jgi:adenylosuccinate synthase
MQGCGAFLADKIMRGPDVKLARDYPQLEKYLPSDFLPTKLLDSLDEGKTILHEGSQGFSLDVNHGSHYPQCTSRQCTALQSVADLGLPHQVIGDVYLVVRPYPIRVGNVVEDGQTVGHSGGCYSDNAEIDWKTVAERCGAPEEVMAGELTTVTKRLRRVFEWSDIQFAQAIAVNGANKIALNFANYIDWACYGKNDWNDLGSKIHDWIKKLEDKHYVEVALVGTGPRVDQVCVRP